MTKRINKAMINRRFGKKAYNTLYGKKITTSAQSAIDRSEILDEIWAADKHVKDGEWYVRLSDVCAILGEDYASKEEKVTYPDFVKKHYKKDDAGKDQ